MVGLLELLNGCLLLTGLILHLSIVGIQVLEIQAVGLLVLFTKLVLVSLVLELDLTEVIFECLDLLL